MGNARSTSGQPVPGTLPSRHLQPGEALVAALATTLRNVAVYPPTHPRVAGAADELLACITSRSEGRRAIAIGLRGNELLADGETVAVTHNQAIWLLRRFRDVGLRGATFEPGCTTDDILGFARAVHQTRLRTGVEFRSLWPDDHPRVRAFDLVFSGTFREMPPGEEPASQGAGDAANGSAASPDGLAPVAIDDATRQRRKVVLEHLVADRQVQQRLTAIELGCAAATSNADASQEVDLLTAVAALLPADVANQPELVADLVKKVLGQVEAELPELMRRNAQVEGAELLRMALGVARKYFHTEAPKQAPHQNLPSGRPEDARIGADLPSLLQELAALPSGDGQRLPPASELVATHPAMARELLGIHLHTFVTSDRQEIKVAVRKRLVQMFIDLDGDRRVVLSAYLGKRDLPAPAGEVVRQQLLAMLIEAGRGQLVRDLGYVDSTFLARRFPESLSLAARLLGKSPEDLTILRETLEALAPVLALGGVDAAIKAGVLQDPLVIEALLNLGGPSVLPLLPPLATQGTPDVQRRLVAYLRKWNLPAPEAAALQASEPPLLVPPTYLRNLLRAATQNRFDAALRTATGELLRKHVRHGLDRLPPTRLLDTIRCLQHVPAPETTELLQELANHNRFALFDRESRAIRRCAQELLASLPKASPA